MWSVPLESLTTCVIKTVAWTATMLSPVAETDTVITGVSWDTSPLSVQSLYVRSECRWWSLLQRQSSDSSLWWPSLLFAFVMFGKPFLLLSFWFWIYSVYVATFLFYVILISVQEVSKYLSIFTLWVNKEYMYFIRELGQYNFSYSYVSCGLQAIFHIQGNRRFCGK